MTSVRTGDFDCSYTEDCFAKPWEQHEVILIQHGFGRNGEYWLSWVPDLARDSIVIRRDMRAHGSSTAGSPDHEWSPESLADDVIAFIDAVGLERVHYVGESIGGITGIVLGARYPQRLHTLTLVQTPLRLGQPLHDYMRGDAPSWTELLREVGPGGYITRNMDPDDPRTQWERTQWDRCDADALVRLAEAALFVDVEHYVERIAVPTLILAPGDSPLTSLDDQRFLARTIPDAEIEVFVGCGHNVYLAEPERCTERLRRFITERRALSEVP